MGRALEFLPEQSYYQIKDEDEFNEIMETYLKDKYVENIHYITAVINRAKTHTNGTTLLFPLYIVRTTKRYNIFKALTWQNSKSRKYAKYRDFTNAHKIGLAIKLLGD